MDEQVIILADCIDKGKKGNVIMELDNGDSNLKAYWIKLENDERKVFFEGEFR